MAKSPGPGTTNSSTVSSSGPSARPSKPPLRLRTHQLQLPPVARHLSVRIEIGIIGHDVLIAAVRPRMVVEVTEFDGAPRARIAERLHTTDQLICSVRRLHRAALRIGRHALNRFRDVLLECGNNGILLLDRLGSRRIELADHAA